MQALALRSSTSNRDDRHTGVAPAMSELVIGGLQDVAKTPDSKSRAEASST
jgi:hypothetical protein